MALFSLSTLSPMVAAHAKLKNVHELNNTLMHILFVMQTFIQLSLKEIIFVQMNMILL